MKLTRKLAAGLGGIVLGTALLSSGISMAADHLDFAEEDLGVAVELAAEITDVLAWTPKSGRLALAMNVFPDAGTEATFSTNIDYQFRLRPVLDMEVDGPIRQAKFSEEEEFIVAIPPEGTRKAVTEWKKGFYLIARSAKVPIVLGYLDYGRKEGGYGPTVEPSGDVDADIARIKEFYADKAARYQSNTVIGESAADS